MDEDLRAEQSFLLSASSEFEWKLFETDTYQPGTK